MLDINYLKAETPLSVNVHAAGSPLAGPDLRKRGEVPSVASGAIALEQDARDALN